FEAQVARTPDAVAVAFDRPTTEDGGWRMEDGGSILHPQCLTYRELDCRANRLARALAARGVGPEAIVAILAERSIDFLIAVVATFKAGAAYLPLDPHHPPQRLGQVLRQSAPALMLTTEGF